MDNIICTAITAVASILAVILQGNSTRKKMDAEHKRNEMHAAKQSILQLILEDHVRDSEGKIPENYKEVLEEFDDYKAHGGNSYIHHKVEEYEAWYKLVSKKNKGAKK